MDTRITIGQIEYLSNYYRAHYGLCFSPAEDHRLLGILSKEEYASAAEVDLLEVYRLDLTEEWHSRRWRRLLNCLDRLSRTRTSWLNEALSADDELADQIARAEDKDRKPPKATRMMRDYSPEVELLSVVADRQAELAQIMAATKGAKPHRVEPQPRPETAYQRAKRRKSRQHHNFTVARVRGYIDAAGNPTGTEPE